MAWLAARGKPSKSILGTPKVLVAPKQPYRMNARNPYRRSAKGLLQFPISVFTGYPLIGTAFTALGQVSSTRVAKTAAKFQSHLTLEFHAVDLLGLTEDGLDSALRYNQISKSVLSGRKTSSRVFSAVSKSHKFERLDHLSSRFE